VAFIQDCCKVSKSSVNYNDLPTLINNICVTVQNDKDRGASSYKKKPTSKGIHNSIRNHDEVSITSYLGTFTGKARFEKQYKQARVIKKPKQNFKNDDHNLAFISTSNNPTRNPKLDEQATQARLR